MNCGEKTEVLVRSWQKASPSLLLRLAFAPQLLLIQQPSLFRLRTHNLSRCLHSESESSRSLRDPDHSTLVAYPPSTMPPKQDLNRSGWESTDMPSACEKCLGDNPYVQVLKEDYGAEW